MARQWEPVEQRQEDLVAAGPVARLAATLGYEVPARRLPALWHWLYFLDAADRADLGDDGHPRRGGFLPPAAGRRVFGGGRLEWEAGLQVGDPIERRGRVAEVTTKRGRSGPLTVVGVEYLVTGPRGRAIVERQELVYTEAAPAAAARSGGPPAASWAREFPTDEVVAFRFSALTFNGHRIHYDAGYARGEGYPAPVVHGPLLALLLAGLAETEGGPLRKLSFRATAPAYVGEVVSLRGEPEPSGARLAAYAGGSEPVMIASGAFADS